MPSEVSPVSQVHVFGPGACFSKVPKLFGRISSDIILFVSSKRKRLEARNFAVIFIFIPFTTYEKISFTEQAGRSFTNGFSGLSRNRLFNAHVSVRSIMRKSGRAESGENFIMECY